MINPQHSPDGLVHCTCCGEGVLEVKCPQCIKDKLPDDDEVNAFCMIKDVHGKWTLKREHNYFYQIQTQMFVCQRNFSDSVVWSNAGIIVERIEADPEFINSIIDAVQHFFIYGVLLEIVGKWYTRKPIADEWIFAVNKETIFFHFKMDIFLASEMYASMAVCSWLQPHLCMN